MIKTEKIRIEELMTTEILAVRPDDPVIDIREKMINSGINHAPVIMSDKKVVGMISSRDVEKFVNLIQLVDSDKKDFTARDIMTAPAFTYPASSSIKSAAQAMLDFNIHAIMVVNSEDELIGILTSTDLLRFLALN